MNEQEARDALAAAYPSLAAYAACGVTQKFVRDYAYGGDALVNLADDGMVAFFFEGGQIVLTPALLDYAEEAA